MHAHVDPNKQILHPLHCKEDLFLPDTIYNLGGRQTTSSENDLARLLYVFNCSPTFIAQRDGKEMPFWMPYLASEFLIKVIFLQVQYTGQQVSSILEVEARTFRRNKNTQIHVVDLFDHSKVDLRVIFRSASMVSAVA